MRRFAVLDLPSNLGLKPSGVVDKILRHSEALGGISRITFQMNASSLPHAKLMRATELLGTRVAPALRSTVTDVSTSAGPSPASGDGWPSQGVRQTLGQLPERLSR